MTTPVVPSGVATGRGWVVGRAVDEARGGRGVAAGDVVKAGGGVGDSADGESGTSLQAVRKRRLTRRHAIALKDTHDFPSHHRIECSGSE
jgi:hypothetical protein